MKVCISMYAYQRIKRKLITIFPLIGLVALELIACCWWYKTHPTGQISIQLAQAAYAEQKAQLDKVIEEYIRLKTLLLDIDRDDWYQEKIIRQDLQMGYPDEKVYLLK